MTSNDPSHSIFGDLFRDCGLLVEQGRTEEAELRLSSEIIKNPDDPSLYSNLALVKTASGHQELAKDLLLKSIQLDPSHYHALHQLGIISFKEGDLTESYRLVRAALDSRPSSAEAFNTLAMVQLGLGDLRDSEASILQALKIDPLNFIYQTNYAQILLKLGRHREAAKVLIECSINHPETDTPLVLLGQSLRAYDNPVETLNQILNESSEGRPFEAVVSIRARYLLAMGQPDVALEDIYYLVSCGDQEVWALSLLMQAYYEINSFYEACRVGLQILRREPRNLAALNTIGLSYGYMNRNGSAIRTFEKANKAHPNHAGVLNNLAAALMRGGSVTRAFHLYSKAFRIDPANRECFYNLMFAYSISGVDIIPEMLEVGKAFWKANSTLQPKLATEGIESSPEASCLPATFRLAADSGSKLRIGILSSDLGDHCVGHFLAGILTHYERDLFHIELICPKRRFEHKEESLIALADIGYSLQGASLQEARTIVKSRRYDAIIECNGYTDRTGIELLADRCSPIQAHYIGYHGSTAMPTMDYFITDGIVVNESMESHFTERILRLRRTWLAMMPRPDMPSAKSVATADRPIFGFFGQCAKITDECLTFWSEVFRAVPRAYLLLKDRNFGDRDVVKSLLTRLDAVGIGADRVFTLPLTANWTDHMQLYNAVDIALDSTPWSSATTAFDALGMGVPLMAIQGAAASARMSSSVVQGAGRAEWICKTPEQYAQLAQSLSADYAYIRANKNELQRAVLSGPLCDTASMARELERALLSIVRCSKTNAQP
jgi:predicted O-linked N-acetylglucosamine transferase (SPINDLY family)